MCFLFNHLDTQKGEFINQDPGVAWARDYVILVFHERTEYEEFMEYVEVIEKKIDWKWDDKRYIRDVKNPIEVSIYNYL